jgi:hypothetical protein
MNNANLISLHSIILSKLKVCRDLRECRTGVHSLEIVVWKFHLNI